MQTDVTPRLVRTTDFARDAARFILDHGRAALAARGLFRLGLSGGNTPRRVHAALAELAGDFPWAKVQITFGDERCVPPDHDQSNYRMAKESLLEAVAIPAGNVFRIRGEIAPEAAALEYEQKLSAFASRGGEVRYVHDLLLLGLGEDGHTASLFPGSPALGETVRNVIPATGPKPPPQRVTMTFPLINAARHVCFLANDAAKQPLIDEILAGASTYPAGRVRPTAGQVTWLVGA
jgi:6-phosphogluconolactonase